MKLGHKITTYVSNPIRKLDYLVSETLLNMASPLFKYDPLLKIGPLFKCITSYFLFVNLMIFYLPGERFAMTEMKMAVVKLLQKFKVEFDETTKMDILKGDMFLFSFPQLNIRFIRR